MRHASVLAEIARRHRIGRDEVRAVPVQGVANRVYFLGENLVLRIARPESADDLRKEAVVIPAAVYAGVRTPELVSFDEELLDTPYMVVRRAPASPPGSPLIRPTDGGARCTGRWGANWPFCTRESARRPVSGRRWPPIRVRTSPL